MALTTFRLQNAEAMGVAIPDRELRANLDVGDVVKLVFVPVGGTGAMKECMWVKVTQVFGLPSQAGVRRYTGALDSAPVSIYAKVGQAVAFSSSNVISVYPRASH